MDRLRFPGRIISTGQIWLIVEHHIIRHFCQSHLTFPLCVIIHMHTALLVADWCNSLVGKFTFQNHTSFYHFYPVDTWAAFCIIIDNCVGTCSDKQVLSFQGSNSVTMLRLCNNYFIVEDVNINHNSELRIFFRPFLNFSILYFGLAGVYPLSVLVSTTWVKQCNGYILFGILKLQLR